MIKNIFTFAFSILNINYTISQEIDWVKDFKLNQINSFKELALSSFFVENTVEDIYKKLPTYKKNDKEFHIYIEEVGIEHFKKRLIQKILLLDEKITYENLDTEWVVGEDEYVTFIKDLQKISRNKLQLNHLKQIWRSNEKNKIHITFEFENNTYIIEPKFYRDWADVDRVLIELNKLLSDKQFTFYYLLDNEIIIGLDTKQRQIIKDLGIKLISPN